MSVTDRIVPNPETGDVVVRVPRNGETKEYTLKMGINASVQLQQRRKMPFGDVVKTFGSMDTESARDVLFVLLQRHHKEEIKNTTQAGEVLEDMGLNTFFEAFTACMKNGSAEGAAGNPQTAAIPTGDSSSSTVGA